MKFAKMMEVHQTGLYVTERHEKWLRDNPNPTYSDVAIDFARSQLEAQQRDRTKSFSASHISGCPRAAQFSFLGLPQTKLKDGRLSNIFHTGNFMHLKWQMAGLTEGWLAHPEVFASNETLRIKGTLDGILDNGWGLELKSINNYGFTQVCQYGEKPDHRTQVNTYFLMRPDIERFSIIYENKDTQDYKEIVVDQDAQSIDATEDKLIRLREKTERGEYFDMRDDCWKGEGQMFRSCPYASICKAQGMRF